MSIPHSSRPARTPARLLAIAMGRRPVVSLLALLVLLYVPWLGAIPLDGTLEGNRVQAAREMLTGGDWIVPRLNGEPYLAKPPLHPWTMALAAAPVSDVCLWSGRLVSVVAALATCLLVFLWGRRELGRRAGLLAALATGTAVVLAEKALRAELELVLTAATTLAVLALHEALRGESRRRAVVVSGLALGAAALVKGPPPLIVYVSVVATLAVLGVERRAVLRAGASALGLALLCVVGWVVPLIARMGLDRMLGVFHDQFVQRLSRTGPTNDEPFWFYGPAILVGMLPAALAAPVVAAVWPSRAGTCPRTRMASIFLWGWALLPLVLFSVSAGKETRYLLPTVPAWGLLLGWGWTRARSQGDWARWRGGLLRAASVAGWLLPLLLTVVGAQRFPEHRTAVIATGLVALAARAVFAWAPAARPGWRLLALAAGVLAGKVAWAESLLVHQRKASPVAELAARVAAELEPEEAWILVGPYRSWLHFQVERPCVSAPDWEAVEGVRAASGLPANVLVAPDGLWPAEAGARSGWREVERWLLDGDGYRLAVRD